MMKTLVIRSSEWMRAEYLGPEPRSLLLSSWGTRCCLGILAKECGYPDDYLQGLETPSDLVRKSGCVLPGYEWTTSDDTLNTGVTRDAMEVNDDTFTTDDEKIAKLQTIFKRNDWLIDWRPDE